MLLEGKGACVGLETCYETVVLMEHFQAYLHHLHAACDAERQCYTQAIGIGLGKCFGGLAIH